MSETILIVGNLSFVSITPDGASSTHALVATVPVGITPYLYIAATPDQRFVYVSNQNSDDVSVIDTATNTVVDTVTLGGDPSGLAVTPDGAFVYVANLEFDNVSVIDTATNDVVATIPGVSNPTSVAVTPDGTFVYVGAAFSSTVTVIATATNLVTTTITATSPFDVEITPDVNGDVQLARLD